MLIVIQSQSSHDSLILLIVIKILTSNTSDRIHLHFVESGSQIVSRTDWLKVTGFFIFDMNTEENLEVIPMGQIKTTHELASNFNEPVTSLGCS